MKALAIVFVALVFALLLAPIVSAADPTLPRASVSCDSDVGAPFTCSAAIDNNAGTRWVSTNSPPYPHHITLTIGGPMKVVTSVALNQACIEFSGAGGVFAGTTQIGSWTGGTSANLTITVTPTLTSSIEFRGTSDHAGGTGYMCAVEVWAFGHSKPDPQTFTFPFAFLAIGLAALGEIIGLFFALQKSESLGETLSLLIGGMLGFVIFVYLVIHILTG